MGLGWLFTAELAIKSARLSEISVWLDGKSVRLSKIPVRLDGKPVRSEAPAVRLGSLPARLNRFTVRLDEPAVWIKASAVRSKAISEAAGEDSRVARLGNRAVEPVSRVVTMASRTGKCAQEETAGDKCALREMFTTARIMPGLAKSPQ